MEKIIGIVVFDDKLLWNITTILVDYEPSLVVNTFEWSREGMREGGGGRGGEGLFYWTRSRVK